MPNRKIATRSPQASCSASHDEELRSQLIRGENKTGRNYQPRGMAYWEMLHVIVQEEPVEERDRFFMYFLKEMGIEKGNPFAPTERQRKILADAVVVGEAMAKNMVFRERLPGVLREDGWRLILGTVPGKEPGDAMEHTQRAEHYDRFDPRARFTYEACTTSAKMSFPKPARGMGYAGMFLDQKGARSPATAPMSSMYPRSASRSLLGHHCVRRGYPRAGHHRPGTGRARFRHEGIKTNPDGSTPIFIGPEAPEGLGEQLDQVDPGPRLVPVFPLLRPDRALLRSKLEAAADRRDRLRNL